MAYSSTESLKAIPLATRLLPKTLENIIISLLNLSPKLILTGSCGLYLLDLLKREPNDIDLGLTHPLTEDELSVIKNFFDLKIRMEGDEYEPGKQVVKNGETVWVGTGKTEIRTFKPNWELSKPIIQLFGENETRKIKIDIFNLEYYKEKDIYWVNYGTFDGTYKLRILHPSIAIGAKAKYAYDPRNNASFKHFSDLKEIDSTKYFQTVKPMKSEAAIQYDLKQEQNQARGIKF
jgi:hypothetical protein